MVPMSNKMVLIAPRAAAVPAAGRPVTHQRGRTRIRRVFSGKYCRSSPASVECLFPVTPLVSKKDEDRTDGKQQMRRVHNLITANTFHTKGLILSSAVILPGLAFS